MEHRAVLTTQSVRPPLNTYQLDSPVGLDLELLKRALKEPRRTYQNGLQASQLWVSSGAVSPALVPALQGYPVDRCLHSKSGSSHLQIDKP